MAKTYKKYGGGRVDVDKMQSFPLILLFFAIAALVYAGAELSFKSFWGLFVMSVALFLVTKVFTEFKEAPLAGLWFKKAAYTGFIAAAFSLIKGTFIDSGAYSWSLVIVEIFVLLTWIFVTIGALIGFFGKWKAK